MKYLKIVLLFLIIVGCEPDIPRQYVLNEKDLVPEGIAYLETVNDQVNYLECEHFFRYQ